MITTDAYIKIFERISICGAHVQASQVPSFYTMITCLSAYSKCDIRVCGSQKDQVLQHPCFSLDLAPCNFWLF